MKTDYKTIQGELKDRLALFILNNPPVNQLSQHFVLELVAAFTEANNDEKIKGMLELAKAMTTAQAKGYIAPFKAIEAFEKGLGYDIDADIETELELFADCAISDVAKNQWTYFSIPAPPVNFPALKASSRLKSSRWACLAGESW